jgi:hypothetical protein
MQKQKRAIYENKKRSNGIEPEWVTRILEVYERIKKENDQSEKHKVRS